MSTIDWAKAGQRLRHQPRVDGRNPDWDWIVARWKDEADYYGDEQSAIHVAEIAPCPLCERPLGEACIDSAGQPMEAPHRERRRASGQAALKMLGPRFGGAPAA